MASLRTRLHLSPGAVYLADGSAFVFRAFYAFKDMTRSDGFPTNILFIVTRLLLRILREERPSHFSFVLDGHGGANLRRAIFTEYKANRDATPEDLLRQIAPLKAIVEALGLSCLVSENCEADDCIASLASRFRQDHQVVIVGADKDLKQCLHGNVLMWDPASKDERVTTLASFREETGLAPDSWPDYQALVGDSSDNIPGVPKIGPKTALVLLQEFGNLDTLFSRLPAVQPKIRVKLEGQKENALLYRQLTTLRNNICPEIRPEALAVRNPDLPALLRLLDEYELRSLGREVESMARSGIWRGNQGDLFAPCGKEPSGQQKYAPEPPAPPSETTGLSLASGMNDASGPADAPPQGKPPSASQPFPGMTQASLFQVVAAPRESAFTAVSSLAALPAPAQDEGRPVCALLPMGEKLLVAGHDAEALFIGDDSLLARKLLEEKVLVVAADVKQLCKARPAFRALPPARWFDLSLGAYLLSPEDRAYGWEQIATRYSGLGRNHTPDKNPGLLALDLFRGIRASLCAAGLDTVLATIEQPLVPILLGMEERGITIDTSAFAAFLAEAQTELDALTVRIHALAGGPFNIRSSQQLSDILFGHLGLPKAGKTKGGAMSTSQTSLEKLVGKHPIIDALLEYRKLEKLRSTYLEPMPQIADRRNRIHTTFNQTATATGRLSSSNPNLQNIPIRGPKGSRMRACFVAAPGKTLVCADYSQVELRVLAHLSGDPTLLSAFHNNEDIHSRTAALLFDTETVTPDQRRNAKTINFGLIYGMGAQKLGQELGISMKEAREFIERYFSRLSRLKAFYDSIEHEAATNGHVVTMTGRRRLTPDILSANNQMRSQARRQAINTRIQGSAADIIKLAMIVVARDETLKSLGAELLLQVHDELVLEVSPENATAAGERLAGLMASVAPGGTPLRVPLLVDWGVGRSWAEAH